MSTPDRVRQVKTTREKHGDDHYQKIGKKGGDNSPTKFTPESGRKAIEARWAKHRAEQEAKAKARKGNQDDQSESTVSEHSDR